ncbi:hypothetical protein [Protaetiibacter intestinalis]|uniref:Potassium transporter Trk n=1 Tax=Protaetiibacter intestinalis TaxID=2419774 RepID=A0A387B2I1_9MICO|nr:hypothetical protein [Protaetiibacter intestinalis]AYF97712.1 hypothetical protein D7I47_05220 [Protaetiibacter intestinalis]
MSEPETPDEVPAAPEPPAAPEVLETRIRRAPKLGVFLLVGAVLGAFATLILTSLFPADPNVGFAATFAYFCLYGVPAGVLVAALIGLALDRRSERRARTVRVEHEQVD